MNSIARTCLFTGFMLFAGSAMAQNPHAGRGKPLNTPEARGTMNAYDDRVSQNQTDRNRDGTERAKMRLMIEQACHQNRESAECLAAKQRWGDVRHMKHEQNQERREKRAQMMMKHHDTNGDGVISRNEFESSTRDRFDRMDIDRNGVVDRNDMQKHKAKKSRQEK